MIAEKRQQLTDVLIAAGLPNVSNSWPDIINPPCVIVTGSLSGYVTIVPPRDYKIYLDVAVLVEADSKTANDELDDLLEKVLGAIPRSWGMAGISRPSVIVTETGERRFGSVIRVSSIGAL